MHTRYWISHFRTNPRHAVDRSVPSTIADPAVRLALARSLAVFQLGETGGGTRLLRFASELSRTEPGGERFGRYSEAVRLFVAEENHHAELLADLVRHLGGELLERQWSNSVFRGVRSLFGLGFNIQVLLTAELIAEAYYGLVHRHAGDPVVQDACAKIVRDEVKHIAFHVDFFGTRFRRMRPLRRSLWNLQFRALVAVAAELVWRDHRRCFRALGVTRTRFRRRVLRAQDRFLGQLAERLGAAAGRRGTLQLDASGRRSP